VCWRFHMVVIETFPSNGRYLQRHHLSMACTQLLDLLSLSTWEESFPLCSTDESSCNESVRWSGGMTPPYLTLAQNGCEVSDLLLRKEDLLNAYKS
jgi:hypothetical protein